MPRSRLLILTSTLVLAAASCSGAGQEDMNTLLLGAPTARAEPTSLSEGTPPAEPATPAPTAVTEGTGATPPPLEDPTPVRLVPEVVGVRPHDATAFTQGFELVDGRLYESRGKRGASALTEIDPRSGAVLRAAQLDQRYFGEGLAVVGDRIVQLTWESGVAFVYEADTFEVLGTFSYSGEGWGLCYDGRHLVMSDGSDVLAYRDPVSFEVVRTVAVTYEGAPVRNLNELECVGDDVYANVWQTNAIVVIDTAGLVRAVVDATGLLAPELADGVDWLNGIAYDHESGNFLLTGKWWPTMYEVTLVPAR